MVWFDLKRRVARAMGTKEGMLVRLVWPVKICEKASGRPYYKDICEKTLQSTLGRKDLPKKADQKSLARRIVLGAFA